MRKILEIFKATFFWSYERGSWQYDLLCIAILLFIFAIPTSFFDDRKPAGTPSADVRNIKFLVKPDFISNQDLAQLPPQATVREALEAGGAKRYNRSVRLLHHEIVSNQEGVVVGYRAWFER